MVGQHRDGMGVRVIIKSWGAAGFLTGLALGLLSGLVIVVVIHFSPGFGGLSLNVVSLSVFSIVFAIAIAAAVGLIVGLLNGLVLGMLLRSAFLQYGVAHRQERISVASAVTTAAGGLALLAPIFRGDILFIVLPVTAGVIISVVLSRRLPPSSRH